MRHAHRGFTLIEILVVVFIVGMVALATTLTMGTTRSARVIAQEANQLQRVLQLVAQTAMIEQVELGVGLWENGYAVWQYDMPKKAWYRLENDNAFKKHELLSGIFLSLSVSGNVQRLLPTNKITIPQLGFSSSGVATPAVITISSGEVVNTVEIKQDGEVVVHESP